MRINVIYGNIIDRIKQKDIEVVIHGANCFHTMGSGVARALDTHTKGALLTADIDNSLYGDINKLGEYTIAEYDGVSYYNLYSQHTYGRDGVMVHWDSVEKGLISIFKANAGERTLIPLIGCGLAGGDIEDFADVILSATREAFLHSVVEGDVYVITNSRRQYVELRSWLYGSGPFEFNKEWAETRGLDLDLLEYLYIRMTDAVFGHFDDEKEQADLIESLEYEMQEVWGFDKDLARHYYSFLVPECTCPVMDNKDYADSGSNIRVYSATCPIHRMH